MQSKLEELARKEEELRRINEALNIKNTNILHDDPAIRSSAKKKAAKPGDDEEEKFSEDDGNNSDDQFKGQNLAKGKFLAAAAAFDEEDDNYSDGAFENDGAATGKSSKMKAGSAMRSRAAAEEADDPLEDSSFKGKFTMKMDEEDEDDDIAAAVAAGKRAATREPIDDMGDEELQSGMYQALKQKHDALLADSKEQDKTINFQKAKIAALQTELEESLRVQAEQKTQIDMQEKESGKS